MSKVLLKNTAEVPIHGRQPTEVFPVPALEDGQPAPLIWRKRLKEGAVIIVTEGQKKSDGVADQKPAKKGK
ncbi:MAG: hypothetical protein RIC14_05665 [Filomicrobium sp.]